MSTFEFILVNMNSYVRVAISTLRHPYGHVNSYVNMSSYVPGDIYHNKLGGNMTQLLRAPIKLDND